MKKAWILILVLLLAAAMSSLAEDGMKVVTFSDAGLEKEAEGITFEGGVLTIRSPGEYMLSGSLADGRIAVDCAEEGKVVLYLNGITVHSETGPALLIGECKPKVVLSLVDQAENTLSVGPQAIPADDEEPNAAVFSQSDLVIEGSGSLRVSALSGDGITSKDELEIHGGTVSVDAKHHGIKGKDCVEIYGGNIQVTAGRDGIKSTNKKDPSRGYVAIRGGTVSIRCGDEPIQVVTGCTIENAKITMEMSTEE